MVGHNWGGLKKWPEKIFKGWLSAYGYPEVNLKNNGEALHLKVHRLVALAFIANPDNKPWVNHKNGIKTDNRVENLEWCTPDENNKHASKTGLFNSFSGTNSALAKVTSEQVLEIRRLRSETKITYEELGKRFGLSGVACLHICKRKTWKHI